uniref:Uncharacterized protein n=1 Tax=Ditylenchus dipsaci TaxID=166011 RepID=A0A915EF53_9BILA
MVCGIACQNNAARLQKSIHLLPVTTKGKDWSPDPNANDGQKKGKRRIDDLFQAGLLYIEVVVVVLQNGKRKK